MLTKKYDLSSNLETAYHVNNMFNGNIQKKWVENGGP